MARKYLGSRSKLHAEAQHSFELAAADADEERDRRKYALERGLDEERATWDEIA